MTEIIRGPWDDELNHLRAEIVRLQTERDLWKMRAEQAQAMLREFNREQSVRGEKP